jgi:hypothetical protein
LGCGHRWTPAVTRNPLMGVGDGLIWTLACKAS